MKSFFGVKGILISINGQVESPQNKLAFAENGTAAFDGQFNRVVRLWFEDKSVLQRMDGDGYTEFEILIIASENVNDLWLTLWVETSDGGCPVAMCFRSDREILLCPRYEQSEFARKLTMDEVKNVFDYIFENTSVLDVQRDIGLEPRSDK